MLPQSPLVGSSGYSEVGWKKGLTFFLSIGGEPCTDYLIQATTELILSVATNYPCQVKYGAHRNLLILGIGSFIATLG